ncbi:unnamed protein product, partial [marine sediment metagenome]
MTSQDKAKQIERLKANIVNADDPDGIDVELVDRLMVRDSFACIRGLFDPVQIGNVYESIKSGFSAAKDNPAIGEKPGAVMKNFQKISIGGAGMHWDYRPRFMRVLYNPLWEPDVYGMHETFRRLAAVRNRLQGKPVGYAIDVVEDNLWTAARMQHYPAGGGNISRHRDVVISTVTGDAGVKKFHQILLLLTTKGKHFSEGGAFIELEGETIEFEEEFGAGDVLLYDGRTMHGVRDIDPHVVPNLNTLDGRLVAMVSLYKDMSRDATVYDGYEDCDIDAEA